MSEATIELWQAEWCLSSQRVRERLTELGLTFTARQVPAEREERTELEAVSGQDQIPVLQVDGETLAGEEAILDFLGTRFEEPSGADAHRAKAEKSRRRQQEQQQSAAGRYAIGRETAADFDDAVATVKAELAQAGFGVLCEIDVQATLKNKLGVDVDPYLILGACNPPLAHAALEAEPELGVLLPCNVIVHRVDGTTRITAVNAERMLSIVGNEQLGDTAAEVRRRLTEVVDRAAG